MEFREILSRVFGFFVKGLLYTVPLVVTGYIIYNLFVFLDSLIPLDKPGLGILALLLIITIIGILGSTIIARPIENYFLRLLERIPLIKTLYTSVSDLLSAFVGDKRRFNRPVLVKLTKMADIEKLGFITSEDLSELGIDGGRIAVYLPHSYAFSGNLFIVPAENVTPLDANAAEVMKFIVSGGVAEVDKVKSKSNEPTVL
ncbi:MAG: DUF502 domain-containing protein [Bacteroidetes bacterium]|jgi:uncharacterized membrane protein|nr:DUF502 domain-containing protein [Bacteroidota bacterium]